MASYLLSDELGVPDPERLDGTTAVHMAFGHRNVALVRLFLGLNDNDELRGRAKSMALALKSEADADSETEDLKQVAAELLGDEWDDADIEYVKSQSQYHR